MNQHITHIHRCYRWWR